MKRRTFIKQSALMSTAIIFPQLVQANWFTKSIKTALYCSRINPVRFIAGLIFDKVSEVYLEPLAKNLFNQFWNGHIISRTSLSHYSSLSSISSGKYEEYKASTVIDGIVDYEKYKENQRKKLRLILKQQLDIQRYKIIKEYLVAEKVTLKLYDRPNYFKAMNELEENNFFDIEYLVFNKHENKHIQNLLELTKNKAFGELVV